MSTLQVPRAVGAASRLYHRKKNARRHLEVAEEEAKRLESLADQQKYAERRAASNVYRTLTSLLVHYTQVAGTVSAAPAAAFWTNNVFLSWLTFLTFDLSNFSAFEHLSVSLKIQLQILVMLAPLAFLYW
eukprot:SAG11_NODE_13965_length_631_cov_0.907895_1_plen_129_part_10